MKWGAIERLGSNRYVVDDVSHIEVDQERARSTSAADLLIRCCPAQVYSKTEAGEIAVEHAACLECGTCLAIAPLGVLTWHYPRGGFGVQFREG